MNLYEMWNFYEQTYSFEMFEKCDIFLNEMYKPNMKGVKLVSYERV